VEAVDPGRDRPLPRAASHEARWRPALSAGGGARASVPSMGSIYRDERSPSEPMEVTVARPQGVAAR
jgi:hypothetical protein